MREFNEVNLLKKLYLRKFLFDNSANQPLSVLNIKIKRTKNFICGSITKFREKCFFHYFLNEITLKNCSNIEIRFRA